MNSKVAKGYTKVQRPSLNKKYKVQAYYLGTLKFKGYYKTEEEAARVAGPLRKKLYAKAEKHFWDLEAVRGCVNDIVDQVTSMV